MSVLVILLPPRPRGDTAPVLPAECSWVFSADGRSVSRQGHGPATDWPRADSACALLADADVAWHSVTLPKAPAAKLRAALGGVLEDALLDDDEAVHLAVEPGARPGEPAWVAVTDKAWLQAVVAGLEGRALVLDRVAVAATPAPEASAHALPPAVEGAPVSLVLAGPEGVSRLPLAGSLARQRLAALDAATLHCTAHPAAAAEFERWIERPVAVLAESERALQALAGSWNLRQFDLLPRRRGTLALREAWRQLLTPAWRPVRWGLIALVGLQLVGLNAWAWRLDRAVQDKRQAMTRLLQATHPQVRAVLDAPVQMQRETEALRAQAGRPGDGDLEPMLAAAATAWPDGMGPLQSLRFEPGRLTLATPGWADAQRAQFAERVRAAGYLAEARDNQVIVSRGGAR